MEIEYNLQLNALTTQQKIIIRKSIAKLLTGFFFILYSMVCVGQELAEASMVNNSLKPQGTQATNKKVYVEIETSMGAFTLELDGNRAPISVKNFLGYVADGFYNDTHFHRVMPSFMIQGGGLTVDMTKKETKEMIQNEAQNGLKNIRGSIAMARTSQTHSSTSQFFVNLVDNPMLDHGVRSFGYAVFGKVVKGLPVVDLIAKVPTGVKNGRKNVPIEPVVILNTKIIRSQ